MNSLFAKVKDPDVQKHDAAHQAWVANPTRENLKAKYEALDVLAAKGKAPGVVIAKDFPEHPRLFYGYLESRCKALDLDPIWLPRRIEEQGINPETLEGWTDVHYNKLAGYIEGIEDHCRQLDKDKAKADRTKKRKKEKDPVSLFAQAKPAETAPAPAPPPPENEVDPLKLQAALDRAGMACQPVIGNRELVSKVLKERAHIINEIAYIQQSYRDAMNSLQSQLEDWHVIYEKPLEEFGKLQILTTGKKSLQDLYGKLAFRNQPESLSIKQDGSAVDELARQKWVAALPEALKVRFQVKPREGFTFNWDALKEWWMALPAKERPHIPNTQLKPATENKFSVGPSLDTVSESIRKNAWTNLGG